MSLAFTWIDFPDGRARFCGLVRGSDELGREVYAVEAGGRVDYGEVAKSYDDRDISIDVVSFGYPDPSQVGMPYGAAAYDERTAAIVERLVRELVATVANYPDELDKPAALRMPVTTRFTGVVRFCECWIIRSDASTGASQ